MRDLVAIPVGALSGFLWNEGTTSTATRSATPPRWDSGPL